MPIGRPTCAAAPAPASDPVVPSPASKVRVPSGHSLRMRELFVSVQIVHIPFTSYAQMGAKATQVSIGVPARVLTL